MCPKCAPSAICAPDVPQVVPQLFAKCASANDQLADVAFFNGLVDVFFEVELAIECYAKEFGGI